MECLESVLQCFCIVIPALHQWFTSNIVSARYLWWCKLLMIAATTAWVNPAPGYSLHLSAGRWQCIRHDVNSSARCALQCVSTDYLKHSAVNCTRAAPQQKNVGFCTPAACYYTQCAGSHGWPVVAAHQLYAGRQVLLLAARRLQ